MNLRGNLGALGGTIMSGGIKKCWNGAEVYHLRDCPPEPKVLPVPVKAGSTATTFRAGRTQVARSAPTTQTVTTTVKQTATPTHISTPPPVVAKPALQESIPVVAASSSVPPSNANASAVYVAETFNASDANTLEPIGEEVVTTTQAPAVESKTPWGLLLALLGAAFLL